MGVLIDREHDLKVLTTWERDLARPQTLAAFGWKVVSIPALAWWREPAAVIEAISRFMEREEPSTSAPNENL